MTTASTRQPAVGSASIKRAQPRSRASAALHRRNRRVESHRDLVRPVALHYARRCQEPLEDLHQVGLLGLIRAAELYRPAQGTPFQSFARPHIRGAILHYLRDEAPSVRLPRRQAELQERLQRLSGQLEDSAARQLRQRLGVDEDHWRLLLRHRQLCRPLPLEEIRIEELEAPRKMPGEERLVALRNLLERLEPRQRQVVRQVVLNGWSYRRLAAQMQVSPMTVQRLLHRGLARLREQLDELELKKDRGGCRAGSDLRGC
jgi:RNA polymerase sigma-B factor